MARKAPTEEQKTKAAARREAFRALAKRISDLTEDERLALAARHGIRTIEGRELSVVNQCLLATQRGAVTVVGGFQQWKRAGRQVRKGESGLAIWVPIGFGKKEADASPGSQADAQEEGEKRGFIMGTVFDIKQTEVATEAPRTTGTDRINYRTAADSSPCPACGKPYDPTRIPPPRVPLNIRCACCCQ